MPVDYAVLDELKLSKGNKPLSLGAFRRRIEAYTEQCWPWADRERDPVGYQAWKDERQLTLAEAEVCLVFNGRLVKYRAAVARLAQVELSVGRAETQVGTGVFEPDPVTGEMVEVMQTIPAIPALVAEMVDYPVLDEATGEQTGTVTEPDREVTAQLEKDAAEREAAQQVIADTPQEVKDWVG